MPSTNVPMNLEEMNGTNTSAVRAFQVYCKNIYVFISFIFTDSNFYKPSLNKRVTKHKANSLTDIDF